MGRFSFLLAAGIFCCLGLTGQVQAKVYLSGSEILVGEDNENSLAADPKKNRAGQAAPLLEGGPGSVSSPYTVYIPLDTDPSDVSATGSREKHTFFGNKMSLVSNPSGYAMPAPQYYDYPVLPSVSMPVTGSYPPRFDNDPYIQLGVYHDQAQGKYLCGAFRGMGDSDYRMLNSSDLEVPQNTLYYVKFYFEDMSTVDKAQRTLFVDVNGKSIDTNGTLYVFEVPPNTVPRCSTIDSIIRPEDYPGGMYFTLRFNSVIETNAPAVLSLRAGDTHMLVKFDSNNTSVINKYLDRVMLVSLRANGLIQTPAVAFNNFLDLSAFLWGNRTSNTVYYKPLLAGEIKTGELANDYGHRIGVVMLSKFRFASLPSNFVLGTPQSIDTFIQKQSCFLLSAGFGEEHFVIEYFKEFRDQFLRKFPLGQLFIGAYYSTAPELAPVIYADKNLSFFVRMMGYLLYYLFRSSLLWAPLGLGLMACLWRRRRWKKSAIKRIS